MDQSSQVKRLGLPTAAGLVGLVLVVSGCQSGAQSDLVARELRLQEDKIYAMQDYLAEYQQLLCQVRAENAALKQQLVTDQSTGAAPWRSQPAAKGTDDATKRPAISEPRGSREPDLQLPPVEVPKLDVPKINNQSSSSREGIEVPAQDVVGRVQLASHAEVSPRYADELSAPADVGVLPFSAPNESETPVADRVWLSGEVVPNESGGPRLVVDVAALAESGRPAQFDGEVSLMVLAASESGPPKSLARWDFPPGETASARLSSPQAAAGADNAPPYTMRFHLELPPGPPIDRPVQLWVRLKSADGRKLLSHAPLDFQRPGGFASVPFQPAPNELSKAPLVVRVVDAPKTNHLSPKTMTPNAGDGWSIARPGETAPVSRGASAENSWRASSQPMPLAVTQVATVKPSLEARTLMASAAPPSATISPPRAEPRPIAASPWSPDRTSTENAATQPHGDSSDNSPPPAISAWSPTR